MLANQGTTVATNRRVFRLQAAIFQHLPMWTIKFALKCLRYSENGLFFIFFFIVIVSAEIQLDSPSRHGIFSDGC
jgi:hypothetical protein